MPAFTRITHDPAVMGGKPCIRGLRVTVGTIVGLVADGRSHEEILRLYPYLASEDIREALSYATARVEELKADSWDCQVEQDMRAGRLDAALERADEHYDAGRRTPL